MTNIEEDMMMTKTIETETVAAEGVSQAVAVGQAVMAALASRNEVDVERGDNMDDAMWSELRDYLGRRGVTLRGGVASSMDHANLNIH
jgi:hypothetical protein